MKLCLPPELYLAVIKFQVQKELGKSYAGLLLVTKAAYQEKLISKEIYEKYSTDTHANLYQKKNRRN